MGQNTVGTAIFRINGVQHSIGGEMEITVLTEKRTPLIGLDGGITPQVEWQSPMVKCTVKDRLNVDLIAITKMEDVTVAIEMANGSVWEIANAFYTGDGVLDAKEGDLTVQFNGETIQRLV